MSKEDGEDEELENLAFSSIILQKLPHMADYLPEIQQLTNPLEHNQFYHPSQGFYVTKSDIILRQILYDLSAPPSPTNEPHLAYHRAGPRRKICFDPSHVRAAIVTCGGLCPGMNTVIRELVAGLWDLYGVREIYGVLASYRGLYSMDPIGLDPKRVRNWHKRGGTALQTSRGGFDLN